MKQLTAGTKQQILDSLFISGGTIDIEIKKTTKNTVKLSYLNENFTLNKHGVLCIESIQDGKTWYLFCPSQYPKDNIKSAIKTWLKQNEHKFEYAYKI